MTPTQPSMNLTRGNNMDSKEALVVFEGIKNEADISQTSKYKNLQLSCGDV